MEPLVSVTTSFRRPDLFVPLSVRAITGRTGTAILNRFGTPGIAAWIGYLTACKLNRPEGEIVYASEAEGWALLGLRGHEPDFTLEEFFAFTGKLRKTRKQRSGKLTYVKNQAWERWTKTQKQEAERQRKARTRAQNERDIKRTQAGHPAGHKADLDLELELEGPPQPPLRGGANGSRPLGIKELRKFTGCRATRGSHGAGHIQDVLGTDKPPPDWPHAKPGRAEVEAALQKQHAALPGEPV